MVLASRSWGPTGAHSVVCVHGVAQHGGIFEDLGRRLAAVLAIFAGSAVGAGLVSLGGLALPLVVTGACIFLVTVAYAAHPASKAVSSDVHP